MTGLRRASLVLCAVVSATTLVLSARQAAVPAATQASTYFPGKGAWEKRDPAAIGMDKAKLDEAIAFAIENENQNTKDLAVDIPNSFRTEAPYNNLIGPTQDARRHERPGHSQGYVGGRVGRHGPRGHDVQRHQVVSVHGGGAGVRPRSSSRT